MPRECFQNRCGSRAAVVREAGLVGAVPPQGLASDLSNVSQAAGALGIQHLAAALTGLHSLGDRVEGGAPPGLPDLVLDALLGVPEAVADSVRWILCLDPHPDVEVTLVESRPVGGEVDDVALGTRAEEPFSPRDVLVSVLPDQTANGQGLNALPGRPGGRTQ